MTKEQTFARVWDAIEDTPAEAESMKVRSALMMQLHQHLEQLPGTDAEKAARLGITRPRYSDLKHGRITRFSIDALVGYASAIGLHARLELGHGHLTSPASSCPAATLPLSCC